MKPAHLTFRPALHSITGELITEVWSDDSRRLFGVLYPTVNGVKFVSKYITNHPLLMAVDPDEPPAVVIRLADLPD